MKNLKFLSALLFISILSLTSCQDEIDDENGNNPNTNSATSPTAQNLERSAMYDGSFDDFLDDVSCSSVLFPVTVIVDNTEITLVSESDYELVLDIIGEFTDDDDSIQFQFPSGSETVYHFGFLKILKIGPNPCPPVPPDPLPPLKIAPNPCPPRTGG